MNTKEQTNELLKDKTVTVHLSKKACEVFLKACNGAGVLDVDWGEFSDPKMAENLCDVFNDMSIQIRSQKEFKCIDCGTEAER